MCAPSAIPMRHVTVLLLLLFLLPHHEESFDLDDQSVVHPRTDPPGTRPANIGGRLFLPPTKLEAQRVALRAREAPCGTWLGTEAGSGA
jgi:hypothetical protein